MGAPKPWPTRWPEPSIFPPAPDDPGAPHPVPDYEIEENPGEEPAILPEELHPYPAMAAVTWGITHPCNLKCPHCYDAVDFPRRDLKTSEARAVINRLSELGTRLVVFSGGEPLLRKDLFDIMAYARQKNITIGMRSNGTLITASIASQLSALNLAVAGISLDGATAATHNAIRGTGNFEKTLKGIRFLVNAGIRVNIEVVLSRRNAHQSQDFVHLAENLRVSEINFSALTAQGRARQLAGNFLDFTTWHRLATQLYHISQSASVTVSPACTMAGTCPACLEPNITCDGWVTACYLSGQKLFHLLETPVADIPALLAEARANYVNHCGRVNWIHPPQKVELPLLQPV